MTKREAGFWLGAAIDGEGHIRKDSNEVTIANTERSFIDFAITCLHTIGVDSFHVAESTTGRQRTLYSLSICGVRNCAILYDALPLSIPRKREALKEKTRDKRFDRCPSGCTCGRHVYYPRRNPRGYSWSRSHGKFRAYHRTAEKVVHLGYFPTEEEAAAAVNKARQTRTSDAY